jgi:GTPase SAR1 family protein
MAGPQPDWANLRREILDVFTPGPPIEELGSFAGRKKVIQRLQDITIERGRHAIIYGERGVGKTSLANIFHKDLNSITSQVTVVLVNADPTDNFDSLWRKVFRRIRRETPDGQEWWVDQAHPTAISMDDVLLALKGFTPNQLPIVIIDEYDRLLDDQCRTLMTDVIKGLVTYGSNCTVVLVGVADSILELVRDHQSISRNLAEVPMERMSRDEIKEIIVTRTKRLRMKVGDDAAWRLSYFSGGLPFYAHSLGKHSALCAVAKRRLDITESDVIAALDDCMADVDYTVKEGYTRATERIYRKANLFPQVLAACALAETNDLGQFTAASVEAPLSAILNAEYRVPSFAFHLNEMCEKARGAVLRKTGARRTFQYTFTLPALQPYVIMKSLKDDVLSQELFERFYVKRQRTLSI